MDNDIMDVDMSPNSGDENWQEFVNAMMGRRADEPPDWRQERPDSPPYNRPATLNDLQRFDQEFPRIVEGQRYIHSPNRRVERTIPNDHNQRVCENCERNIPPYRPGSCPSCYRDIRDPLPASVLAARTCLCLCPCPEEFDDPIDGDYIPPSAQNEPTQRDDESDEYIPPQILASTTYTDHRGQEVQRTFHAEPASQYEAAAHSPPATDEFSSTYNAANSATTTEASILYRRPFRGELAGMLALGYSRDEIRQRFHETRVGSSTSYLPADPRPPQQAPAVCWACRDPYPHQLRDAMTMGFAFQIARTNLETRRWPERLESDQELVRRLAIEEEEEGGVGEALVVFLCRECGLPRRAAGEYRGGRHECRCRCSCA